MSHLVKAARSTSPSTEWELDLEVAGTQSRCLCLAFCDIAFSSALHMSQICRHIPPGQHIAHHTHRKIDMRNAENSMHTPTRYYAVQHRNQATNPPEHGEWAVVIGAISTFQNLGSEEPKRLHMHLYLNPPREIRATQTTLVFMKPLAPRQTSTLDSTTQPNSNTSNWEAGAAPD